MFKRGISPLIATVLIIGFTVALAAVIMLWGGDFVRSMQERAGESAEKSETCAAASVEVDDVEQSGVFLKFVLENVGRVDVDGVIVRVTGDEGVDSVVVREGLRSAGKRRFNVQFEAGKTGDVVTRVEVVPKVGVLGQSVACAPGVALAAEAPSAGDVAAWQVARDNDNIDVKFEECDASAVPKFPVNWRGNPLSCTDFGFDGGDLSCTEYGTIDVSDCTGDTTCGNSVLDIKEDYTGEQCDYVGGVLKFPDPLTGTCANLDALLNGRYGFTGGKLYCDSDCMIDILQCEIVAGEVEVQQSFAGGGSHTCLLISNGDVYCWGYNYYGQLGDNKASGTSSKVPVAIDDTEIGKIKFITAGSSHTCAVDSAGVAWCWGWNGNGQLGRVGADSAVPVKVDDSQMGTVRSISAGDKHTCAVDSAGVAWCWGSNFNGQLGRVGAGSAVPVKVDDSQMGTVKSISAGYEHTCAVDSAGVAWCWGSNDAGQLGWTGGGSAVPVKVDDSQMGTVKSISAGYEHTCAVDPASKAWCWGNNYYGQLGDNKASGGSSDLPVKVVDSVMVTVKSIAAFGEMHTCAVDPAGVAWCWGLNSEGQLGRVGAGSAVPVKVDDSQMGTVTQIALGTSHSAAVAASGRFYTWGYNFYGQLGDGTDTLRSSPVEVSLPL